LKNSVTFRRNMSPLSSELCLLPATQWFLPWLTFRPWRWRRYVEFEVVRVVVIMSSIFCDVNQFSPLKIRGTFRRKISPPSSGLLLLFCFMLISCLAHSSTLKIEEICSSTTSVVFQRSTRRYIPRVTLHEGDIFLRNVVPEDCTLHSHRIEHCKLVVLYMPRKL
jgi:hypothetical protein